MPVHRDKRLCIFFGVAEDQEGQSMNIIITGYIETLIQSKIKTRKIFLLTLAWYTIYFFIVLFMFLASKGF